VTKGFIEKAMNKNFAAPKAKEALVDVKMESLNGVAVAAA